MSGEGVGKLKGNENVYWYVSLSFIQSAHSLNGAYTSLKYVNGSVGSCHKHECFWRGMGRFVSLKYRTISNRNLSFGSMLLKINDSELKGQQIFRNLGTSGSEIINMEVQLKRENKNA